VGVELKTPMKKQQRKLLELLSFFIMVKKLRKWMPKELCSIKGCTRIGIYDYAGYKRCERHKDELP